MHLGCKSLYTQQVAENGHHIDRKSLFETQDTSTLFLDPLHKFIYTTVRVVR